MRERAGMKQGTQHHTFIHNLHYPHAGKGGVWPTYGSPDEKSEWCLRNYEPGSHPSKTKTIKKKKKKI